MAARIIPAWAGNTRLASATDAGACIGSSPHGRGTRLCSGFSGPALVAPRIIPAWAGNTAVGNQTGGSSPHEAGEHIVFSVIPVTDHPRMGGEHGTGRLIAAIVDGRIIPAWAGNTHQVGLAAAPADHPRMGGEPIGHRAGAARGSSPHGRGTRFEAEALSKRGCGSSPHGRGTRRMMVPLMGNHPRRWNNSRPGRHRALADHPRMGGEHSSHNYLFYMNLPKHRWTTGKMAKFCGAVKRRHSVAPETQKQRASIRQSPPAFDDCDPKLRNHSLGLSEHPKP